MGIDIRDPDQPVGTLSGGERQSVAIARAVYFGARVLILDEPTSALGVKQAGVVLKYILQARDRGVAVIFITHNPHHAYPVGDRFVILNRGQSLGTFEKSQIDLEELVRQMAGGRELVELRARARNASRGRLMRLTAAQALVRFLAAQHVERDGVEHRFFGGCFGIFGHGNVAGIGEALYESPDALTYYQGRNEQAMVHAAAAGYARMRNRLGTLVCTSSIGPGATNMVTGAALATINRLPVLLVPGDVFASRAPDPVLQQLEDPGAGDVSVNDVFRPVSRYFDRIWRPEQLVPAALQAMRVLVNQAETGAVTLAFPQDVQTEAFDDPRRVPGQAGLAHPAPAARRDGARTCRRS